MAEYQKRDTQLSYIYEWVAGNSKPKLSEIHHIRSKTNSQIIATIWQSYH